MQIERRISRFKQKDAEGHEGRNTSVALTRRGSISGMTRMVKELTFGVISIYGPETGCRGRVNFLSNGRKGVPIRKYEKESKELAATFKGVREREIDEAVLG